MWPASVSGPALSFTRAMAEVAFEHVAKIYPDGTRAVDDITDSLVLSRETVRTHVKRILRKLGVHSQAEAVEVANGIRSSFAPGRRAAGDGRRRA